MRASSCAARCSQLTYSAFACNRPRTSRLVPSHYEDYKETCLQVASLQLLHGGAALEDLGVSLRELPYLQQQGNSSAITRPETASLRGTYHRVLDALAQSHAHSVRATGAAEARYRTGTENAQQVPSWCDRFA
jgi:hypothetical protein